MKSLQKKNIFALYILFIFGTLVFLYSYACASVNTFPTEGWHTSTPEKQGMHSEKLSDMLEKTLRGEISHRQHYYYSKRPHGLGCLFLPI